MTEVKMLKELVQYQDHSIVSQAIVDKPSGSITVFAFAAEESLSEHTAPFDALVQVLDGEAEIRISGTPFRLGPGEVILMPAGKPHAVKAVSAFKMMLTMIREKKK